jgi:hypothetical protein
MYKLIYCTFSNLLFFLSSGNIPKYLRIHLPDLPVFLCQTDDVHKF